jgi:hypothetical protein
MISVPQFFFKFNFDIKSLFLLFLSSWLRKEREKGHCISAIVREKYR